MGKKISLASNQQMVCHFSHDICVSPECELCDEKNSVITLFITTQHHSDGGQSISCQWPEPEPESHLAPVRTIWPSHLTDWETAE